VPLRLGRCGEIVDVRLLLDVAWTKHFGAELFATSTVFCTIVLVRE
jgi:hypothetical protein